MASLQIILSVLGLIGIGGIVTAIMTKRKEIEFRRLENKEKRYKSCLLYMDVYFNPPNIKFLSTRVPDIATAEDVLNYLKAEYHEMILYASREVVLAVRSFIQNPTRDSFLKTILVMRKDLWTRKNEFEIDEISV